MRVGGEGNHSSKKLKATSYAINVAEFRFQRVVFIIVVDLDGGVGSVAVLIICDDVTI